MGEAVCPMSPSKFVTELGLEFQLEGHCPIAPSMTSSSRIVSSVSNPETVLLV